MNIGIGGQPSTGKTTSFRNLDPKTTALISPNSSVELPNPFGKGCSIYSKDNPKGNIFIVEDFLDANKVVKQLNEHRPDIKLILIDDTTHFIYNRTQSDKFKALSAGSAARQKWSDLGSDYHKALLNNRLREDLDLVVVFHTKVQETPGGDKQWEIESKGNVIDQMKPVSWFNIFFQTAVLRNEEKEPEHVFVTRNDGVYNLAKTPFGMFEETYIPNDLNRALKIIKSYYAD